MRFHLLLSHLPLQVFTYRGGEGNTCTLTVQLLHSVSASCLTLLFSLSHIDDSERMQRRGGPALSAGYKKRFSSTVITFPSSYRDGKPEIGGGGVFHCGAAYRIRMLPGRGTLRDRGDDLGEAGGKRERD